MDCTQDSQDNLSPSHQENHSARSTSRKSHCGIPQYKFRISGLRCILLLIIFSTMSFVHSYVPEKYPIEVYHMLQERSQYGFGRDNRVRGSWGSWSSWSECSRSCGTGVQSQARQCVLRNTVRKRSVIKEGNSTTSLKPVCIGTYKRYHICNTQECPDFSEDFRAQQCAKYNDRLYKGENHAWVPFLNAPNPCALNCRAVGERFYATLEPAVVDGTPCDGPNLRGKSMGLSVDRTEQWLCVAGQCRSVGCDGVIGSGAVRDTCGVCGGQGRGCKLFEGIFMEPILPKGHQPITTIPRGAMSLNISELRHSSNYLALKAENGSYILNGPWSVSPSGIYKAAGSIVTYQRGDRNRMESITATGPLTESVNLEIWYHEMNPGILYKYMLPAPEITDDNAILAPPLYANEIPDHHSQVEMSIRRPQIDLSRNHIDEELLKPKKEEVKFSPTTVMAGDAPNVNLSEPKVKKLKKKKRKFSWKVVGLSPCSKTCGGGVQSTIIKCVREDKDNPVPDRRCRKVEKPPTPPPLQCNDHSCPPRWRADAWSECSVTCGSGVKTRRLECVQDLNSKLTIRVAAGACSQPPDLSTVGVCTGPPCSSVNESRETNTQYILIDTWEVGPWSPCSSSCGKGFKNRTITCKAEECSEATRPVAEESCETPCSPQHGESIWLYTEWSSECSTKCDHELETRKVACSDGNELFCDPLKRPASEKRCPVNSTRNCTPRWFTGPWSPCSVMCGEGTARREVICIGYSSGESKILSESNCTSSRPPAEQNCRMPACPPEWFTSDWNMCTASCGGGTQERVVRCLHQGLESSLCDEKNKPELKRPCNIKPCSKSVMSPQKLSKKVHINNDCVDKYPNCGLVVKAGLCRIKYYKHSCCGCLNQLQ
ncbi:thrombospondin type-1 domain-containing protein 4 [Chelonus insularis]|uniref:thrombospondin type-1 domain-containing protein 4 n=1 Tax=Chelonus insularis TaxID=460826 RepID=UPI001589648D|nr:thrombospondin type-1 domain-containing protein 4 [Chelonus insularis]